MRILEVEGLPPDTLDGGTLALLSAGTLVSSSFPGIARIRSTLCNSPVALIIVADVGGEQPAVWGQNFPWTLINRRSPRSIEPFNHFFFILSP